MRVRSAKVIGIVRLLGKQLAFHKKSKRDGSGKCNWYDTGNSADVLYTVLYEFDYAEKGKLDALEGLGYGYEAKLLDIHCNGNPFKAFIYAATLESLSDVLMPNHEYKEMVLLGARYHGFPVDYIASIESIVSVANPYPEKQAEDEEVLVKIRLASKKSC